MPVGEPASLGEGDCEARDGVAGPLLVPLREPQKLVVLCADGVAPGVPLQQAVALTSPDADPLAEGWEEPVAPPLREPEVEMVADPEGAAETVVEALADEERVLQGLAV